MGTKGLTLRILIIGASGLLGYELGQQALQKGHEVFLLSRSEEILVPGTHQIKMDLENLDLNQLPKVDAIYYLAQSKKFRNFPDDWWDVHNINVNIPLLLIAWAKDNNVSQFHLASSGGVYSGGVSAVEEHSSINANRDLGFYLSSRLASELLAKNFAPYFKSFTLLRPFFMYGKRQNRSMLLPRLVDSVMEGKEVFLNGEEGLRINPIHVSDAAKACLAFLEIEGFNIFNLAGPEVLSMKEICNIIGAKVNRIPNFVVKPKGEDLVGDNTKVLSLLSKKMISFKSGVEELIPKN